MEYKKYVLYEREGVNMKRYLIFVLFIILIFSICVGCNNEDPKSDLNVSSDITGQNDQDKDNGDTPSKDIVIIPSKKVSFDEAFLEEVINNPQMFLEQIIAGFKIGMTDEDVIQSLGEPDEIKISQGPWGEENNWIYENVQNYQLIFKIANNSVFNFEVSRYIDSTGIVPKLTNKPLPEPGEPLLYKELGFEGVVLGLRIDEVLNRLGDPLKGYLTYDEMYGYDLAMIYKGITVHIILGTDNPHVQFIETNSMGNISTYRNISINSSIDDVITNYGQPDYPWETSDFLIYSTSDYWYAIKFEIKDGYVKNISVYNAS